MEITCDLLLPFPPSPNEEEPLLSRAIAPQTTTTHSNKRRSTPSDWRSHSDESSGTEKSAAARKSRSKKPWYAVQKDEKNTLTKEIARLRVLKDSYLRSVPLKVITLLKQQRENEELRQALQEQRLLLARVQSALAESSIAQRFPIGKYIHLGSSQHDRVATFAELRPRALHDAERYIEERLRCLDPTQKYSHSENFTTPNGDLYFSTFDVIPLEGVHSVKQVFDAMRVFYFNMEITWTETSNELMIREGDYESGDQDVVTHRFARSTSLGTQIESNSVMFSLLRKGSGVSNNSDGSESDSAVFAIDFVDQDELYPYHPNERLRQDVAGAVTLKAYPTKKKAVANDLHDGTTSEPVVVLTRAYCARMHCSELELSSEMMEVVKMGSSFCFKTMLKTVGELIESPPTA